MFDVEFLIFCNSIEHDQIGENYLGVFDIIYATHFPAVRPSMITLVKLRTKRALSGEDIKTKLEIERENEIVYRAEQTLPQPVVPKGGLVGIEYNLLNVILKEKGKYYVNFYINNKNIATRILEAQPATEMKEIIP